MKVSPTRSVSSEGDPNNGLWPYFLEHIAFGRCQLKPTKMGTPQSALTFTVCITHLSLYLSDVPFLLMLTMHLSLNSYYLLSIVWELSNGSLFKKLLQTECILDLRTSVNIISYALVNSYIIIFCPPSPPLFLYLHLLSSYLLSFFPSLSFSNNIEMEPSVI